MTWRMKLADWISGGAIAAAKSDAAWWRDHMVGEIYGPMADEKNRDIIRCQKDNTIMHKQIENLVSAGAEIYSRELKLQSILLQIAAMETPRCANIGKRMAAVAREALE